MRLAIVAILLALMAGNVGAQDAPSSVAKTADQAKQSDAAKEAPQPKSAAASDEAEELRPPPGFKFKKRGNKTLYCRKGSEIGTRFVTETCYDETQMRQYLLEREQNQADFEQGRSICATGSACTIQ